MVDKHNEKQLAAYKEAFALVDELSKEQIEEFKEAFGMFDHDKSGLITTEGVAIAISRTKSHRG